MENVGLFQGSFWIYNINTKTLKSCFWTNIAYELGCIISHCFFFEGVALGG